MPTRTLLALLAAAFFSAPSFAFIEADTYRHGATYRTEVVGSAEECRALCSEDAQCQAWSAFRPGLRGDEGLCELKSAIPPASASPCCASGVSARIEALRLSPRPASAAPAPYPSLNAEPSQAWPSTPPVPERATDVPRRELDEDADAAGLSGGRQPRRRD